jgi:hypothetical protein
MGYTKKQRIELIAAIEVVENFVSWLIGKVEG